MRHNDIINDESYVHMVRIYVEMGDYGKMIELMEEVKRKDIKITRFTAPFYNKFMKIVHSPKALDHYIERVGRAKRENPLPKLQSLDMRGVTAGEEVME
jgi:pentatricopeptide repeat protein